MFCHAKNAAYGTFLPVLLIQKCIFHPVDKTFLIEATKFKVKSCSWGKTTALTIFVPSSGSELYIFIFSKLSLLDSRNQTRPENWNLLETDVINKKHDFQNDLSNVMLLLGASSLGPRTVAKFFNGLAFEHLQGQQLTFNLAKEKWSIIAAKIAMMHRMLRLELANPYQSHCRNAAAR